MRFGTGQQLDLLGPALPPDGDVISDLIHFFEGSGDINRIDLVLGHAIGQQGKLQIKRCLILLCSGSGEILHIPEISPAGAGFLTTECFLVVCQRSGPENIADGSLADGLFVDSVEVNDIGINGL